MRWARYAAILVVPALVVIRSYLTVDAVTWVTWSTFSLLILSVLAGIAAGLVLDTRRVWIAAVLQAGAILLMDLHAGVDLDTVPFVLGELIFASVTTIFFGWATGSLLASFRARQVSGRVAPLD